MWSASEVARYGWVTYLHLFFVLHQPLMPLPPLPLSLRGLMPVLLNSGTSKPRCGAVPSPLNHSFGVGHFHSRRLSRR